MRALDNVITFDFHSHILPGADHGSDGAQTSRSQLDIVAASGIKTIVATPHFYPTADNVKVFFERRNRCAQVMKSLLRAGDPQVLLGAEVLICEGIERMDGLRDLAVFGTDCILLEMPMTRWTDQLFETVDAITGLGLRVVMAHIDRYDPKYIDELMKLDVLAQLNPGTFTTRKGRKFAKKWLEAGKVAAVGSDLHGADEKEYKTFIDAGAALGEYAASVERAMSELLDGAKSIQSFI